MNKIKPAILALEDHVPENDLASYQSQEGESNV
jgi:hypothetical protein